MIEYACPACHEKPSRIVSGDDDFMLLHCAYCNAEWRRYPEKPEGEQIWWYANRWYDEQGIPHHFGIQTSSTTLRTANSEVKFNMIEAPVNFVYGPCSYDELMEYMHDVNVNADKPDDVGGDIGTFSWLE